MVVEIFIALGVSIGVNALAFLISFILKKDFLIDVTYAMTFIITIIVVMAVTSNYGTNQYLLVTIIGLWAIRLGTFLLFRIHKKKVDHRFDKMRHSFWKFGLFWMLQGVMVWIVNMPAYIILANVKSSSSWWYVIFIAMALFFVIFETIADFQKYIFNNQKSGQFINVGLWKISRHPNYFGEMGFWLMVALFVIVVDFKVLNLLALVSPLFISLMLYKVSGVPILEKNSFKRFGSDPNYIEYLKKTPCVIPFLGKKGYKETPN